MVQFFPGDDEDELILDTFDESAWPYGTSPANYIRAIPYSTTFHDERSGGAIFSIAHDFGNLLDVVDGEAISTPTTASTDNPPCCYLVREVSTLANVRVELECDLYFSSGTIGDEFMNAGFYAVWARMQEGTKVNGTAPDEYLGDAVGQGIGTLSFKGYGLYVASKTDTGPNVGVRFALVKLRTDDANGPEVLAELTQDQWQPYDPLDATNTRWGPSSLALEVTNVLGDVIINGYQRDFKSSASSSGVWTQILSYTDTSSPFTLPGRCGFSLPQIGGNNATLPMVAGAKAQVFQIEELT